MGGSRRVLYSIGLQMMVDALYVLSLTVALAIVLMMGNK